MNDRSVSSAPFNSEVISMALGGVEPAVVDL